MRVAVIGAGYVGLVTGAGLAALGHDVVISERDRSRLAALKSGSMPIFEPGLQELVTEAVRAGTLTFSDSNGEAARHAAVVFIAVPTPQARDGRADVSIVEEVIAEISSELDLSALLVLKSTMPTGAVESVMGSLVAAGADAEVIVNPEFLREGQAVADFFNPDRIVLGTRSQAAVEAMIDLYRGLDAPLVVTDPMSATLIKYASNAFLATRVTFANAVANLSEAVGADARDVLLGMGYDHRIGFHFFSPGPGYGGSCFPKDISALAALADDNGYEFKLLRAVIEANDQQIDIVMRKVRKVTERTIDSSRVGLWGLAFKAGTDDVRDSPAVRIADRLVDEGAVVRAFDPKARYSSAGITQVSDPIAAVEDADVLIIATEWPEFRTVDFQQVKAKMRGRAIVDARNLLDPKAIRRIGFDYQGIGR